MYLLDEGDVVKDWTYYINPFQWLRSIGGGIANAWQSFINAVQIKSDELDNLKNIMKEQVDKGTLKNITKDQIDKMGAQDLSPFRYYLEQGMTFLRDHGAHIALGGAAALAGYYLIKKLANRNNKNEKINGQDLQRAVSLANLSPQEAQKQLAMIKQQDKL